ncbi:hypothetical protein K438DRAFT_2000099 [Mycena galopus ATCC 62051]|nr:hypothetical protein K438DRAFT_2000099 [Mycena galopus ATCC 62051]
MVSEAFSLRRRAKNVQTATSQSRHLIVTRTERAPSGRVRKKTLKLTAAEVRLLKAEEEAQEAERLAAMTRQERQQHDALCDLPEAMGDDDGWEDDILRGNTTAEISHAGEAIQDEDAERVEADEDLLDKLHQQQETQFTLKPRCRDPRTRRDRTQIMMDAFAMQLEAMTSSYMCWSSVMSEKGLGGEYEQPEHLLVQDKEQVWVVDLFSAYTKDVPIAKGDEFLSSAYIRQGLMPTTPYDPKVLITVRALEVFRTLHLRCPHLRIQAFVRGLCDLHGVPLRPNLGAQFSIAFDGYLSICAAVDKSVQATLSRDTLNWRLKNACPACMYKLEGEKKLALPFLTTMDGNNSLKRFWRQSKERDDDRVVPRDYYLPRTEVDAWAKDGADELMRSFESSSEEDEGAGCSEGWQNMKEDVTAHAWGMYDETGIFPALCRHGFVLVVVDMAKYGLSVINHLIRVLGEVRMGHDIGCKTAVIVKAHPRLSQLASDNRFRSLIGSFHGHGHNRLCQVSNLATYVEGMGLEDCEGCESFFSKSNALAPTTRYSTAFHRQQLIMTYLKHADDCDAYQGLTVVIANKYRRTLKIKQGLPVLHAAMKSLGVTVRDEFAAWLGKEKQYLRTLTKEPVQETLEMEYYQKLVNYRDSEERAGSIQTVSWMQFVPTAGDAGYAEAAKQTRRVETQRQHAEEVAHKSLAAVQDLEVRLGITTRWVPGSEEWEKAAKMVSSRRYQRALDQLQRLVVVRMFELTKLRKQIAKALQVRSKAVKSALERYNVAAAAMAPPKLQLSWAQVVEYAFLVEFDLLREGCEDIRAEPWALPAGRVALDQHYKMLRAEEEIERLNVEIACLVTYMADEEEFLVYHKERLRQEGEDTLAHQVRIHRGQRGRFNAVHMERLVRLSKEPGFTADISSRGVSVSKERRVPAGADASARDVPMPDAAPPPLPQRGANAHDEEDEDEDLEGVAEAFEAIVRIAHDVEATGA